MPELAGVSPQRGREADESGAREDREVNAREGVITCIEDVPAVVAEREAERFGWPNSRTNSRDL